ncbi:MAG: hypothetical protein K6U11_10470 [bacterium]|nr:hypothetical protein [bacterium]
MRKAIKIYLTIIILALSGSCGKRGPLKPRYPDEARLRFEASSFGHVS